MPYVSVPLDLLPMGAALVEGERITAVNPPFAALFGWEVDALRGQALDALGLGAAPAEPRSMRARRKDGGTITVQCRTARLDEGRVLWVASARDDRQERLERLVATAPGVVYSFRLAPDGTMTFPFASAGADRIFGLDIATLEADANHGFARVHPDDLPEMFARIQRSAETLQPWIMEFRIIDPESGVRWVEGRSSPVREADGGVIWHGLMSDVTARRRAEDELRTSRAQLLAALAAGNMGTWTVDRTSQACRLDALARTFFGLDAEQVTLDALLARIHGDDRTAAEGALVGHSGGEVEVRLVADRATRWVVLRGQDEPGPTPRVRTGVAMDVTGRKDAEAARRRSHKLEALGTLAGGIAHDFNNLLAAINGNLSLASELVGPDHPAQESLHEVIQAGHRATELVRRIVAFARTQPAAPVPCAVRPVVTEALGLLRATLPSTIEIATELPDVGSALADPIEIHQCVVNLVTNAAHAIGSRSGHVRVSIARATDLDATGLAPGRYVAIEVGDDGCGMSPEVLERVFDPFFTTQSTRGGSGLGLSVVHGIVKAHGGTVTVTSAPGTGSTFRLFFPATEASVAQPRAPAATPRGAPRRVLYVDDEATLVRLAERTLARAGHVVTGFTDPIAALAAYQAAPDAFDVVVTDLAMPTLTGVGLLQAVHAVRPEARVIVMSGYIDPTEEDDLHKAGAFAILEKPGGIDKLPALLA